MSTFHFSKLRHSGQALLELAVVMPVLMLLTIGAVDLGRVYYCFQAVESAAQSGAQFGCQTHGKAGFRAGIRSNALLQVRDIADLSPTVTSTNTSTNVTVTVNALFKTTIKWPAVPQQIPLSRTASMRILR